jgi:hypothetical protein
MEDLLKKYSKWLNSNKDFLDEEGISDDDIVKVLKKFEDNKNNPKLNDKDIYNYTWETLVYALDNLSKTRKEVKSGDIDLVYEDNKIKVIAPKTHLSSCLYGKGTKWCTTNESPVNYIHYSTGDNILLYVIDKTLDRENEYYKLAILFNSAENKITLWDSKDRKIGNKSLFDSLFNTRGKDEIISYVDEQIESRFNAKNKINEITSNLSNQLPDSFKVDYMQSYFFNKIKKPKSVEVNKIYTKNNVISYKINEGITLKLKIDDNKIKIMVYEEYSNNFENHLVDYKIYEGQIPQIDKLVDMIKDICKSILEIGSEKTKRKYMNMSESLENIIKKVLREETGSASTGSYETPGFLAKNIPNMRQGAKTIYNGGKFVKIKGKCRKFPYCSQGAVDAPLELSNKYKGESSLSGEMKLTPTYPKNYKGNVHLAKTKWVNEDIIPGGKSSGISIKDIARKHEVSPKIAMREWLKGIKVEMEHTNNKRVAREIAKDHLYEDIFYYQKLSKIEN